MTPKEKALELCNRFYNGTPFDKTKDNYKTIIGFNKYDYAVRKFYTQTSCGGSTLLGYSKKDLKKVFKLFKDKYDINRIDSVDFSRKNNGGRHTEHLIDSYMNMPQYTQLLEKLYCNLIKIQAQ